VAEEGVAAHWRYKDQSYGFDAEAMEAAGGRDPLANLRQLVQVLEHGGDAEELVEHAKLEMFLDQVFVFSPKGQLVSLPRGAMPLDFAYAVHTNIGDTCIGAKINGELKPLRTPLQNGDVVEIIRSAKPVVPPDWKSLTVTGRARSAIRRHIRQTEKESFVRTGVAAMDQALLRVGKHRSAISFRPALEKFAAGSEDELFDFIGRGRITTAQVLETLFPGLKENQIAAASARTRIENGRNTALMVRGSGVGQGTQLRFDACCRPVPGDRIVGIRQEGVLEVHTIDCPQLAKFEDQTDAWRDLSWSAEAERNAVAVSRIRATVKDAPGVLGEVCSIMGQAGGNITGLNMHHRQANFFDVDVDIEVKDLRHLTNIVAALRANPSVETVDRAIG